MDNDSRIDPQEDPIFRESKTEYIPAQEEKTVYIPEEPEPAATVHSDETEAASENAGKIRLYPDGSWDCTCGLKNKGRFCSQCGQQRPAAAESRWVCSCGLMNTANYCSGCGKAKPVQRSVFRNLGNTDSRPRQAPPPLTFEDREKIKDVYNKVKKRYATGCTVSVVMCSVTSIFTIIMMVYYGMVYSAEHGRHGAQSLTEFISIWTYSLSGLVLIPSLITLIIVFFKTTKISTLKDWFPGKTFGPGLIILPTLVALGFTSAINILNVIVSSMTSTDGNLITSLSSLYDPASEVPLPLQAVGLLYLCLGAPILEEILFRGFVLNLCSPIKRSFAVIVSAMMFSLTHMNFAQLLHTFVLGLLFGYVVLKAHSLLPSIIMHIVFNSTTVLVDYCKFIGYGEATLVFLIPAVIIGIICLIILFKRYRSIDERTDGMKSIRVFTDEEMRYLRYHRVNKLTSGAFFSTWSFWTVIGLFVFMIFVSVIGVLALR